MESPHSSPAPLAHPGPDTDPQTAPATQPSTSHPPPTSPPYWQHSRGPSYTNDAASERAPGPAIILEDNESDLHRSSSRSHLWAKSISIDDYVIVRGSSSGIGASTLGAYVVWNCKVQTLDGGPMVIRKRYSEFDELRSKLREAFPQSNKSSLPPLPPKSAIYKFRPQFLEKRRQGLAYFLQCVMLNPEYAGSSIVKDFIFPPGS